MKIFKLKINEYAGYDTNDAFVIIAKNESKARKLASLHADGEGEYVWLNPRDSTCTEIGQSYTNKSSIVIISYNAG